MVLLDVEGEQEVEVGAEAEGGGETLDAALAQHCQDLLVPP